MPDITAKKLFPRWLLEVAIIFFIVACLTVAAYFIFEKIYQNKIYPGVFLGSLNLSGQSQVQAEQLINQKLDKINQNGFNFYTNSQQLIIFPIIASLSGDIAYKLIDADAKQTAGLAFSFGRGQNFFLNFLNRLKTLAFGQNLNLVCQIDGQKIKDILQEKFQSNETPAKDAKLIIEFTARGDISYNISQEQNGIIIDYNQALTKLTKQIYNLDNASIKLTTLTDYPKIYKKDGLNIDSQIGSIINLAPLTLKHEQAQWQVEQAQLADWLALKINPNKNKGNSYCVSNKV